MKIFFIILFTLISNLYANEKTNISLQLNWLNQFQFAGFYMAKEKGFYKDVGLDVNITEFKNNTNLTELIINNKADFAIGRSSLIIDKIQGKNIVALAAMFQTSPLMLLTTNANIKTINDIKNKKIMITSDAEVTASITAMLNSNNIYLNDLIIKEHSFNIDDLINKEVDLLAAYISNEPILLEQKNIPYKIFHPKDFGFDFYDDLLFTSSDFIKQNPTTTKNFYEASIKGWEYAFKNKTQTAEIIFEKYNTQNKTLIQLIKEAEILEKLVIPQKNKNIGYLDENKLKKISQTFRVLGLTKNDLNVDSFIYEDNHNKKVIFEIDNDKKNLFIAFIIFIFIILFVTIYFLNKLHIRKELLSAVINTSDDLIFYKNNRLKYSTFAHKT
ncbi:MAG: ABC transporter substrate-binding protein [Aliarcobacter sp.]|nr:ABC transporter substrate-binding protein [Aliarcobacter sp.]